MWKRKPPLIDAAKANKGVSGWVRRLSDIFDAIRLPVVELLGGGVFRRTQTGLDGSAWFETGVTRAAWARVEANDSHVIIAIHGTGDSDTSDYVSPEKARWWQEGSEFHGRVMASDAGRDATWLSFHWHGANSDRKRHDGARKLAELCGALESRGRTYSLIGHSHGGNVIDYAFGRYSFAAGSPKACTSITCYGSPFFSAGFKPSLWGRFLFLLLMLLAVVLSLRNYGLNYPVDVYERALTLQYVVPPSVIAMDLGSIFYILQFVGIVVVPPLGLYILAKVAKGLHEMTWSLFAQSVWRQWSAKRWLCVALGRDEVLGLLPKIGGRKLTFLQTSNTAAMLSRFATLGGSVVFVAFVSALIVNSMVLSKALPMKIPVLAPLLRKMGNGPYLMFLDTLHAIGPAIGILFAAMLSFLTYHLIFLIGRWTFVPLFTTSMNATVAGTLKASIYGDDHDYKLKGVQLVPHYLAGRLMCIDNRTPGNLSATTAATVTEAIYEGVIGFESAEKIVSDPQALMATLMGAIYHNAYFDDVELTQMAISHIAHARAAG